MRRESFVHFAFWLSFIVLISILKNYLTLDYWPFWVGGLVGTVIPDLDHFIYVLFLNPHELTSQRVNFLMKKRDVFRVVSLLYETRYERKNLVFHTFLFQIIFIAFTFFIVSSSLSIFVRGLVLSFSLHLIVDQLVDIFDMGNLDNWGRLISTDLTKKGSIYYVSASFLLLLLMGILM